MYSLLISQFSIFLFLLKIFLFITGTVRAHMFFFLLMIHTKTFFSSFWLFIVLCFAASKYCPLLIKEGGISLLEKVLELDSSHPETKDMAR